MEEYYIKNASSSHFISRVYMWMTAALLITTFSAYFVSTNTAFYNSLLQTPLIFFGIIIAQIALVFSLSFAIYKLSYEAALIIFLSYSALTGITLAPLIKFYSDTSIAIAFGATTLMFGVMALYGYYTRADLTRMGSIFTMCLVGLILSMGLNFIFRSSQFEYLISFVGALLFSGLVAYDMQHLKRLSLSAQENTSMYNKLALLGALKLYLDLINLFIYILRLVGRRRQN